MQNLGIGQLAKQSGVPIDTIRHYERIGLLKPATRLASGYRRYGDTEARRLRFIRRAKDLGFTLVEIRELLALSTGSDMTYVRHAAQKRLDDVARRIEDLKRIQLSLRELIEICPGHGRTEACPILNALAGERS